MKDIGLFDHYIWRPFRVFGWEHSFFNLHADTVLCTWAALLIILIVALIGRLYLFRPNSIGNYCAKSIAQSLNSLVQQVFETTIYQYYLFIGSLFTFILICNCLILIPGLEEPTKDLNTTFALSIIAFLYIQKEILAAQGIKHYIGEFFKTPLPLHYKIRNRVLSYFITVIAACLNLIIGTILLPLELISKGSLMISLSFRLFGNIFAGSVIHSLLHYAVSGSFILQTSTLALNLIILLFFGLFEGAIQAFVFATLTATYINMGIQQEEGAHS